MKKRNSTTRKRTSIVALTPREQRYADLLELGFTAPQIARLTGRGLSACRAAVNIILEKQRLLLTSPDTEPIYAGGIPTLLTVARNTGLRGVYA